MNLMTVREQPVNKFAFLKQAVVGVSDGVMIPFVVTIAFSVLSSNTDRIWQAGLVAILAGAVFMGVAGYFAAQDRKESLVQKTTEEEEQQKQAELARTVQLFKHLDLGKDMQDQVAFEIEKDTNEWNSYLGEHLSEVEPLHQSAVFQTAITIAVSYIIGGVLPVLPYLLFGDTTDARLYSIAASLLALLVFGFIKSYVNKEPLFWGSIRMMLLGGLAAAAVFMVANLFVS